MKKIPKLMIVVVVAGVVAAGVWLLQSRRNAEEKPGVVTSTSSAVTTEQIQAIVGRWRRPDGGYVIDIRGLDATGRLVVAYYNPRPINVSKAQVVQSPRGLHVFIELRDEGYPGATYRLDYDRDTDSMTGVYFQPSINQSFDVVFVREP